MVFKFATFDPAQDPDDFNPAFPPTPSSSPSVTLCQPCEYTCTFTKTIVSRLVSAGASLVLGAPAFEIDGREIEDETPELSYNYIARACPAFQRRQLKEFTLKELKVATGNFSNKKLIGRGGFGQVYKGRLADGSLVAIKRCKELTPGCIIQFKIELEMGSIIPPGYNLISMLGFCKASKDLLLVYPLMIHMSAADCLRVRSETQPPLDWPTRRKIAVGVARGLSHLHDLKMVHRDIKAANILLDEKFEPHIGDFGLARAVDLIDSWPFGSFVDCIEEAPVLPRNESQAGSHSEYSEVSTAVRGTIGHIAPEYLATGKCSVKNDVFAFGIMLLELVTAQRAFDLERLQNDEDVMLLDWVKQHLVNFVTLVDPALQGEYDHKKGEITPVTCLALHCASTVPGDRPSMEQVVRFLQQLPVLE